MLTSSLRNVNSLRPFSVSRRCVNRTTYANFNGRSNKCSVSNFIDDFRGSNEKNFPRYEPVDIRNHIRSLRHDDINFHNINKYLHAFKRNTIKSEINTNSTDDDIHLKSLRELTRRLDFLVENALKRRHIDDIINTRH